MPYIKEEERKWMKSWGRAETPGDLNYSIMMALLRYLELANNIKKVNYAKLNEVMGVLECVKQEFYRRVVVPYEEKKIKENGDLPYPGDD